MLIETETTPNPRTLKFLPGRPIAPDMPRDVASADAAQSIPLARDLFALGDVTGVHFGADFIAVSLAEGVDWADWRPTVLGLIMDHLLAGQPLFAGEWAEEAVDDDPRDAGIVAQIRELIDSRVRPAVAGDGGDIVYRGFRSGTVYLSLRGSCAGCPSSTATLKGGIENLLRHYVPEVSAVEAV